MIGLLLSVLLLLAHPIHTTVLELQWDPRARVLQGTLRIFEDDLLAAAQGARLGAGDYVLQRLRVSAGAKSLRIATCGETHAADAVLMCVRAGLPADEPRQLRIHNSVLMDRHPDQVNIVRLSNACSATVLFTSQTTDQRLC